jgi:aldose 1-epimerase
LEDPRISRLYLAIVKGWFASLFGGAWMRRLMRSGMVTAMLLCGIVIGLGIIYQQHMRGNFHKLKQQISAERPDTPVPRPGGQEAIVLTRSRLPGGSVPEFLSVTLLPGRGMNVLQITAYLPDKGEVSLMDSPGIEEAERAMTGRDSDANGAASLAMGGAFEAPWAGSLFGAAPSRFRRRGRARRRRRRREDCSYCRRLHPPTPARCPMGARRRPTSRREILARTGLRRLPSA